MVCWLRQRTHDRKAVGSSPLLRRLVFHASFIWIKSMEAKFEWKLTWHCCICCNPAKGRVEFEDGWLIKSSFLTKDEMIYFLLIFVFIRECCVTLIFFNGLSIHLSRISCKYLFLKSRHFLLIDHQMRTPSSFVRIQISL